VLRATPSRPESAYAPTVALARSRAVRATALAASLLFGATARADRNEVYAVVGYEPGLTRYELPATGSGSTTSFAGALAASVYYGLTNTLHVGGRLRVCINSDVRISEARLTLPDGSQSTGDVFEDHRSLGLGALALYRLDTGLQLAPVFEVEAGFTSHQYRRIAHVPAGAAFTIPLPDVSETVLHGSAALLVEYRFANRWVAAAGVGVQGETSGLVPWSLSVPLRFGVIW